MNKKYEKAMNDPSNAPTNISAKTMMMFMVKGVFTEVQFIFPCCDVSVDPLHKSLWDCIYRLESCGFKFTADGASVTVL